MNTAEAAAAPSLPLYVDLDGTLIATDLLHESVLRLVRSDPLALLNLPRWLLQGKAQLKHEIAQRVELDVSSLPYREEVLELIREARAEGRRVVLATASNLKFAQAVAQHLGLFDAVLASDGHSNMSGARKLAAIREDARAHGDQFAYVGDQPVDLPIWRETSEALLITRSAALESSARAVAPVTCVIRPPRARLMDVLYGLRLHQWLKNLLIALPLLPILPSASQLGTAALLHVPLAMLAFSLMASAIYVVNDLLDLEADRRHVRKRHRPFASGLISIPSALGMSAALFIGSVGLSLGLLPGRFTLCLLVYMGLSLSYSLRLKRRAVVDVCVLALLYTLRIVAGAMALGVPLSLWMFSFSVFLFLSLAFAKRYVEIAMTLPTDTAALRSRGYLIGDQTFVIAAGAAAGQLAVVVLLLYLNDPLTAQRFKHPQYLWALGPILLFWLLRLWLKANRRRLHDDPVVFAARDWVSRVFVLVAIGLIWLSA
ncbi:UbiA family prenyltransferase [Azohydromonas caseinilytica]|uniref:UbiA family prenyltransferase n=1 Tax=Azohydromonas caseinilytica TaxID=2728836 RepID=A0A848FDI5_9BURK|nr:UbiA family prenyltransferase [Azohydromonas caseinilytica]NML17514.1 UbiA family prenyltransferase [Azohydromonas caseinilytica]